jgi:hypothetical protein
MQQCQCSRCKLFFHSWELLNERLQFLREAFQDGKYVNLYAQVRSYSCKVCKLTKEEEGKPYSA